MRRFFVFAVGALLIQLIAVTTFAQQSPPTQSAPEAAPAKGLEGRWTGSMQIPNAGEMEVTATFKKDKEKDVYTGGIIVAGTPGERPFKSVKVDGDAVQAQAEFETPNGSVVVNYNFTLKDGTLKGKGEADLGGQKIPFDIDLKRAAEK
jgi:autotransporter translocation and assembly factor TamB